VAGLGGSATAYQFVPFNPAQAPSPHALNQHVRLLLEDIATVANHRFLHSIS